MDDQAAPETEIEAPAFALVPILAEELAEAWPLVAEHVATIVERSEGRESPETLIDHIAKGAWQLWGIWDGKSMVASVWTEIAKASTGKQLLIVRACSGTNSHLWLHLIDDLKDWGRQMGCEKMEMYARKGWARMLPEFKLSHVFLEADL